MGICRTRWNILNSLSTKREGTKEYTLALETLRKHFRECPECQRWFHSFPTEEPEHIQETEKETEIINE
jgi:hypothetical protein